MTVLQVLLALGACLAAAALLIGKFLSARDWKARKDRPPGW
jgi:hypothetical protein